MPLFNERYPHKIRYSLPDSGGEFNPVTGEYSPIQEGTTVEIVCRANPNRQGRTMERTSGTNVEYAFDLGFPLGVSPPPANEKVKVIGVDGEQMYEGIYIRSQVGVFSIRGWI